MRIHLPLFWQRRQAMRVMRDTAHIALMESNALLHEDMNELKRQIGKATKTDPRRELLVIAAMSLADKFDDSSLAFSLAPHLSESELEPVTQLLYAAGRLEAVGFWERFNRENDDSEPEPDDQDQDQDQPTAA